jgi:hypothetical protein
MLLSCTVPTFHFFETMVTKKHKKKAKTAASYNTRSASTTPSVPPSDDLNPSPKSYAAAAASTNAFSPFADDDDLSSATNHTTSDNIQDTTRPSTGDLPPLDVPIAPCIQRQLSDILKVLSIHTTCLQESGILMDFPSQKPPPTEQLPVSTPSAPSSVPTIEPTSNDPPSTIPSTEPPPHGISPPVKQETDNTSGKDP